MLSKLKQAFSHTLFYKSAMIKNSLDRCFGLYENNVTFESEKSFIVEMNPKFYTNGLKKMNVKFDFIDVNNLKKIINVSIVK